LLRLSRLVCMQYSKKVGDASSPTWGIRMRDLDLGDEPAR
jgi:hypothetical protein